MATIPSLSACSAYATPCVSCYLGAATTFVEPPFNITQTIDVTIIPLVTGLPNGQNTTNFQTITDTAFEAIETGAGQQTIFGEDETITWPFNGLALTFPTTYAYFENFSGTAAPTTAADECADISSLTPIAVPTATNQASYLYTPRSGIDARKELTYGILPTSLLGYLGTLEGVTSGLNGNAPSTCSPTIGPGQTTYTCLSVVPSSSCFSTFTDSAGSTASSCSTGTGSQTSTLTVTVTASPDQTSVAPIDKVSAASLRRITGRAQFVPYTPPVDATPVPTPSPAEPQIIGPDTPPTVTQPVQPDAPAQNQPPPGDDNVTPQEDNPPQQDSPTTDDQPAVPEDGTSTPDGTSPSPQSPQEDDSSPPADDDSTSAPTTEEPPQDQNTDDTTPPVDDVSDPIGEDSDDLPTDDSDSAPPLTEPPLDPIATDSSGPAATPDAGTTGPGDYIASGLGASGSRTLTAVGTSGTSVTVEPYTGAAAQRKMSYCLALLGVAVSAAALF